MAPVVVRVAAEAHREVRAGKVVADLVVRVVVC